MNDRVAAAAGFHAFAEIFEDQGHVRAFQNGDKILHIADERFVVQFRPGNEVEKVAEKRICFRNQFRGLGQGELPRRGGHDARGKQTVSQRLREHVGEFRLLAFVGQFRQQRLGKDRAPVAEHFRGVAGLKCQNDAVADEMRELREAAGQILRAFNADRIVREKFLEHFFGVGKYGRIVDKFAVAFHLGQTETVLFRSVHEPAKIEIVREQKIGHRGQITFELIGFFCLAQ